MQAGRILIVDDERFFRELYRAGLESRGHSVRTASSAEEALDVLSVETCDLLLADIVMPGMDGVALVKEALRRDPDLEAVAITGDDGVRTAVRAMKAGCADFLTKPVERDELAAVVDRALERVRVRREHGRLLDENLQYVKSQALFRECLGILATLDLERLHDVVLQVLVRITDAQAAAIWIAGEEGELVLRGYRGVVERTDLPATIDVREGELAASIRGATPFPVPGSTPGEAFYVPLVSGDEPLGLVLLAHRARGPFGTEEHATALAAGDFAAIAVRNARRFQALERVGLRDKESGAYNLSYFVDYAGKELFKARRYGRSFSLLVLAVDNLEQMRREAGRELFRCAVRDLVGAASRAVRDADVVAKAAENEYYVLLPETDHFGALMFLRRALQEIRREESVRKLEERCPVLLSIGAATYPRDGDGLDDLLHHARIRAEEQRGSLLRRLHLDDLEPAAFWELTELLLADAPPLPESSPAARLPADADLFGVAQREAARELLRDPKARGLVYVGATGPLARAPVLEALDGVEAQGHVVLFGRRDAGQEPPPHPLVTPVWLDGERRLDGCEFLLFLSEHSAYALLHAPGRRLFHTSDAPLVDALVSKLQTLYDLQPA